MNTTTMSDVGRTNFMQRLDREVARVMELSSVEKVRILIVEDDEGCRNAFKAIFNDSRLSRCAVEFAESVNEAMALIATRVFDLLVLDYKLADGTAADLVRQWRQFGYEVPFVCVSGDETRDEEMQQLGALNFISRECASEPSALERVIRYALHNYWKATASGFCQQN